MFDLKRLFSINIVLKENKNPLCMYSHAWHLVVFKKISEKATAGQEVKPDQFCIRWAQLALSSSQLRNVKCNI